MAYLGLSPDYPDQYLTDVPPPGWVDAKKQGFPVTKTGAEQYDLIEQRVQPGLYTTELPMTPQQIEAAVKREQSAPMGGGLVLAAIAALLMLGA